MATTVLGTAGRSVGGPLGQAIGATIGRQIDRVLFGGERELSDVRFQTSHYGKTIPAIFGGMRVAGTLIWASEPKPAVSVSKDGSRRGFVVDLAISISSRRVEAVHRVWADGRLIRGADGEAKIGFTMRLLKGGEDQPADPFLTSIGNLGSVPAYRGQALVIFERLDLSSFGNRVPNLTFEISEGGEGLAVNKILHEAIGAEARTGAGVDDDLGGFAFDGQWRADPVGSILSVFPRILRPSVAGWQVGATGGTLQVDELLPLQDGSKVDSRARPQSAPSQISLTYFEAENDYAIGSQVTRMPGGGPKEVVAFAGVLDPPQARGLSLELLIRAQSMAHTEEHALPVYWLGRIFPGDRIELPSSPTRSLVVDRIRFDGSRLILRLCSLCQTSRTLPAGSGLPLRQIDQAAEELRLIAFDLPAGVAAIPGEVAVAVAGGLVPYRPHLIDVEGGGWGLELDSATMPSPMGKLVEPLPSGWEGGFDDLSEVLVSFDAPLEAYSTTDMRLLAGANLLWVGGEFLQFGDCEPLGADRYRFRHLLRARHGSRQQLAAPVDTPAILVDRSALIAIPVPSQLIGQSLTISTSQGMRILSKNVVFEGLAARPWKVAGLQAARQSSGWRFTWAGRGASDRDWGIVENVTERTFEVVIIADGEVAKRSTVQATQLDIADSELPAGASSLTAEVRELGTFGIGHPSTLQFK